MGYPDDFLLPQGPFSQFQTLADATAGLTHLVNGVLVYIISLDEFFYWKSTPIATWYPLFSSVDGIGGSGTLNYIPKFTPNGGTLGNSLLFDDGSTVMLGTTIPFATPFGAGSNFNVQEGATSIYNIDIGGVNAGGLAITNQNSGGTVGHFALLWGGDNSNNFRSAIIATIENYDINIQASITGNGGFMQFSGTDFNTTICGSLNTSAYLSIGGNTMFQGGGDGYGLLIPRVSLTSTTDITAIVNGNVESLLVYNFNTGMTGGTKGFYFWNGSAWLNLATTAGSYIGGSGTLGYIPRFTPDGVHLADSLLFQDSFGFMGFYVTSPVDAERFRFGFDNSGVGNTALVYNTLVGVLSPGDNITGTTTLATGIILSIGDSTIIVRVTSGSFIGETSFTDTTSSATANVGGQTFTGLGGVRIDDYLLIKSPLTGVVSIDSLSRILVDATNVTTIDWGARQLNSDWEVTGTLQTGDPGSGSGKWELGKVISGSVTADTSNYIEVSIDGVVIKLMKAL